MSNYFFDIVDFHNGDRKAFKFVFDSICHRAINYMVSVKKVQLQDAEDIFSESMAKLYEIRQKIDSLSHAEGFVIVNCKFLVLKLYRSQSIRRREIPHTDNFIDPYRPVETKQELELIGNVLGDIPEKWKNILYMFYEKELSFKKIGEVCRYCPQRSKEHLEKCLSYLKEVISGKPASADDFFAQNKKGHTIQPFVTLTHNGKTKTVKEWADELNVGYHTLMNRIHRGMDNERILEQPVRVVKTYNYNGKENTIAELSSEFNINYETLRARLNRGWPVDKALEKN